MGTFSVSVQVGSVAGPTYQTVEALVDTGATYAVLPSNTLHSLGIQPVERFPFELADDRVVEYEVGHARVRLDGRERIVLVVFGPESATPLLGATTLELFGLGADPVGQRLVPVRGLLK
ncbi:MAG: retroviral-like aspartic protease family protein [Chloroflexota bacterium]|nr:retroviral-like aspartic protease family protein [Chloroflexota bacterium]